MGDVHLLSLRPELEGFIVPSKFYGIAAAGRPAILVGSRSGEIANIISEAKCGIVIEAGDSRGLALAIQQLNMDRSLCEGYGKNARQVFEKRFDQLIAFSAWQDVLRLTGR